MKIKTDETGKTTCELSAQDRKTLAAAKTILERLAYHTREQPGDTAEQTANMLAAILHSQKPGE